MSGKSSLAWVAAFFLAGCGQHYTVTRVVDGRVIEGSFVDPSAYAAYLRGAVAEGHGDLRVALREYETAAKLDDADPEIWTRIGAVRCAINPNDLQARVALRQALIRDEDYAPAWEARASCEIARDVDRVDVERAAARAAEIDPRSSKAQTLLAQVEDRRDAQSARKRLIALTLAAGDDATAWTALGNWAGAHGDADLQQSAFSRVAELAPSQWPHVTDAVTSLAGDGALREARSLAGALADAQRRVAQVNARGASSLAGSPLVARLAVDDAITKKDSDLARSRASTGRLALDEVAARAALLGDDDLAREIADEVARSDPKNFGATAVLAAVDASRTLATSIDSNVRISAAGFFAVAVSRPQLQVTAEPMVAGDSMVSEVAAKLGATGRVDRNRLSAEAEIEAEVRAGKVPPLAKGLDARHRFIACAFQSAGAQPSCDSLTRHFAGIDSRDLFVNVALAHLAVARGAGSAAWADRLLVLGPNDPLAAATARELRAHQSP